MGFAWDVWGNGRTAVRGGFGVYHGLLDTLDYRLDQTAPFNTADVYKKIPASSLTALTGSTSRSFTQQRRSRAAHAGRS